MNPVSTPTIPTTTAISHGQQQTTSPTVVAGYALVSKLGSGSFATVYKGVRATTTIPSTPNPPSPTIVAIKAISRTSEKLTAKVLANLELEIKILTQYRHRHVVSLEQPVYKTDDYFYMILEYCAGGDVQQLIRRAGRLGERLTRRLVRDLAAGLHFLWEQQLIHRDIKPQNLLLTGPVPRDEWEENPKLAGGEGDDTTSDDAGIDFCLKIADFGFARHLQTTSLAETLCGSPLYMAPEILQHHR